jgi:hypothetical protein
LARSSISGGQINDATVPRAARRSSGSTIPATADTRWTLARTPVFAAAILTLAIGIGGTTAVFSLIDAVLPRRLPFPAADRRRALRTAPARIPAVRRCAGRLSRLVGAERRVRRHRRGRGFGAVIVNNGERCVSGATRDESFFQARTSALVGRTLVAPDDRPGAERVVVLSFGPGSAVSARRAGRSWPAHPDQQRAITSWSV